MMEKPMAMSRKRIREAREELVRRGVLVDSGQRARNPRTGELQIQWMLNPALSKEEMDALVDAPDRKQ
jgi:hypothetical protein